ncbi:MAG: protein kinase, partial [Deltaproteobacteria bacterium]|nr:protein kinase [Deltaproteobacteria bacterium]
MMSSHLQPHPPAAPPLEAAVTTAFTRSASPSPAPPVSQDAATEESRVAEATSESRLAPGTLVDRYVILDHIGAGGLGDVYTAHDPELDRRIAIKLLRPLPGDGDGGLGDPTIRLLREAQATARLHHRNVVTVYDVGTRRGQVFMAMEFVQGVTLSTWLRRTRRRWAQVRDVMLQAGQGLAAAHDANLVHRDFKPQNVIIGDDGRVVVLDFGLARRQRRQPQSPAERTARVHPAPAGSSPSLLDREVTEAGIVLGTPHYMSADLFEGGPGSPMSDQFAFCVALYEALHGQRPFLGRTLEEQVQLVEQGILSERGKPNRKVPTWLHRVALRGLLPRESERFGSLGEVLHAMTRDRRRRRSTVLAALVAVPLLSAAGVGLSFALQPEPTVAQLDLAASLATEARAAAASGYYVHPPAEDPQQPTAYLKILELESLDSAVQDRAGEVARGLRNEMAGALVRLGDKYFDQPGGPPFAADFYATALVFDPNHERARQRSVLTAGELADLRAKAASGEFSEAELVAVEPLSVLAETDEQARKVKARKVIRGKRTASSSRARLARLLDAETAAAVDDPNALAVRASGEEPGPTVAATRGHDPEGDPTVDDDTDSTPHAAAPTAPALASDRDVLRDRKAAKAEVSRGTAALRRGDLSAAESHFHHALELDRSSVRALEGLTDLYFERGDYNRAVRFGKRGVGLTRATAGCSSSWATPTSRS